VTLVSNISDVQSVTCQISRGRVAVATGPDGTGTPASWDDARSMFDKCEFVHSPTVRSAVLYGVSASPNDARGQVAAGHSVVPPCRGEDGECFLDGIFGADRIMEVDGATADHCPFCCHAFEIVAIKFKLTGTTIISACANCGVSTAETSNRRGLKNPWGGIVTRVQQRFAKPGTTGRAFQKAEISVKRRP